MPLITRLTNRLLQFLAVNALVWGAIYMNGTPVGIKAGVLTTATTAVYLLGGVLLARIFRSVGEWLAIGMSLILAFGLLDWALH